MWTGFAPQDPSRPPKKALKGPERARGAEADSADEDSDDEKYGAAVAAAKDLVRRDGKRRRQKQWRQRQQEKKQAAPTRDEENPQASRDRLKGKGKGSPKGKGKCGKGFPKGKGKGKATDKAPVSGKGSAGCGAGGPGGVPRQPPPLRHSPPQWAPCSAHLNPPPPQPSGKEQTQHGPQRGNDMGTQLPRYWEGTVDQMLRKHMAERFQRNSASRSPKRDGTGAAPSSGDSQAPQKTVAVVCGSVTLTEGGREDD